MTDNEIIKALECCRNGWCNECPYKSPTSYGCVEKSTDDVLDLINRLKAEREDYKSLYENSKEEHLELIKAIKHTKSEARKEFAERLKEEAYPDDSICTQMVVAVEDIDNLLKELEGEQ